MRPPIKPIPTDIAEHITYDPETGVLTWLRAQTFGNCPKAGDIAGYMHASKCLLVGFRGKMYAAHRVAWFLKTHEQPPPIIDHADLDRSNNRWANLREATTSQNIANRRGRGLLKKGVRHSGPNAFEARIRRDGKEYYLGYFHSEDEAHAAYMAAAISIHGEFARAA